MTKVESKKTHIPSPVETFFRKCTLREVTITVIALLALACVGFGAYGFSQPPIVTLLTQPSLIGMVAAGGGILVVLALALCFSQEAKKTVERRNPPKTQVKASLAPPPLSAPQAVNQPVPTPLPSPTYQSVRDVGEAFELCMWLKPRIIADQHYEYFFFETRNGEMGWRCKGPVPSHVKTPEEALAYFRFQGWHEVDIPSFREENERRLEGEKGFHLTVHRILYKYEAFNLAENLNTNECFIYANQSGGKYVTEYISKFDISRSIEPELIQIYLCRDKAEFLEFLKKQNVTLVTIETLVSRKTPTNDPLSGPQTFLIHGIYPQASCRIAFPTNKAKIDEATNNDLLGYLRPKEFSIYEASDNKWVLKTSEGIYSITRYRDDRFPATLIYEGLVVPLDKVITFLRNDKEWKGMSLDLLQHRKAIKNPSLVSIRVSLMTSQIRR